ncbi:MAG: hypothetical protein ACRDDZ_02005 [Marinifilaceae bacterium]
MQIKGVITGDIINSTSLTPKQRELLIQTLRELMDSLHNMGSMQYEMFRGDSFQIIVDEPQHTLEVAILLRAGLNKSTPKESKQKWDARMAIGIGTINYTSEKVTLSDGEAFHLSGREFDQLDKKCLAIRTPWTEANEELAVSTAFADDIISGWTSAQAQVIFISLSMQCSQKEIALEIDKTTQNVSKLLNTGKQSLIELYIQRYKQIINNNLNT